MGKFLGQNSLPELLTQIKTYFIRKSDATEASTVDVDTAPTASSTNLVTSGGVKTALDGKQNTLAAQTAYSAKGSATKVPQITTNTLGQVTGITEVTITQPTVNNGQLTMQVNGTQKATFTANQSTAATFNVTAADLGLTGVMKFIGISTTDPSSTSGATVSGHTTWAKGEVVLYKASSATTYKEYVNTTGTNTSTTTPNPNWELLGDEGSYVVKGTTSSSAAPGTNIQGAHTHTVTIPKVTPTSSKLDLISVTPAVSNGTASKVVFGTSTTASKATAGTAVAVAKVGTAVACDDITAWTANTPTAVGMNVNGTTLELSVTAGTAATLSYTARSIAPAVSNGNITPYSFADVTVPVVSSNTTVDVAKAGTAVSVADGTVSSSGTGTGIVTALSVTTETSGASSSAGGHSHTVNGHTHTVG